MDKRLGRGLGSLLGSRTSESGPAPAPSPAPGRLEGRDLLGLDEIRPNPFQPREVFDSAGLQELRASIQNHGILQPIVVRPADDGYELISGERRWRAARMAGLDSIPVVIREEVSDDEMLELALVENLQRRDLDPIERARGYHSMAERLGLTQDQVARRVGLQRSTVANHLRLLELDESIQSALSAGRLSMGHARALLAIPDAMQRLELAHDIEREGLSVREVERRARGESESARGEQSPDALRGGRRTGEAGAAEEPPRAIEPWARGLEERLKLALGSRVEIRNRPSAAGGIEGQIVLHYYDREQLEGLIERLAPTEPLL